MAGFLTAFSVLALCTTLTYGDTYDPMLLDALLRNPDYLTDDAVTGSDAYSDNKYNDALMDSNFGQQSSAFRENVNNPSENQKTLPSIRDQEFIQHSSLWGAKYVQGGAGEGDQRLKPDGSIGNFQVVKSDRTLPAYCDPPNPCPLGYSSDEFDCIEEFTNSASFSREYQSSQECMCDQEHMFDCPLSRNDVRDEDSQLDTLARSLANNADLSALMETDDKRSHLLVDVNHRVVAKKFFSDAEHEEQLNELKDKTGHAWESSKVKRGRSDQTEDFWLSGEMTPFVMAKKSPTAM